MLYDLRINGGRTSYTRYYLLLYLLLSSILSYIKDYDVMIDVQNVFDQPVKNNLIIYENIQKIATG